jgi:hypothetical protein
MRVCQFRHDGNLNCEAAAAPWPPCQEDQPLYFTALSHPVKLIGSPTRSGEKRCLRAKSISARDPAYPSFAVIEIFAFSTFDTGQPFSAASAYF